MKTIIIAVYSGRDVRDILRTNVLNILKESNLRIVILSSAYNEKDFVDEFADENIVIGRLYLSRGKVEQFVLTLMNLLIANAIYTQTNKIKLDREIWLRATEGNKQKASSIKNLIFFLKCVFSKSKYYERKNFRILLQKLFVLFFPDKHYKKLFEKYKPDLVFLSHSFTGPEISLINRAIQENVPTIAIIPSWDNLSSKGIIPVKIDKLIVWNEIMKREAIELHNYSPNDIYMSGIPQYDLLTKKGLLTKEQFFRENNLDINKKLITYAMGNDSYFPEEYQVIEIIDKAITNGTIKYPTQILVRRYTKNIDNKKLERISKLKHVILQRQDHQSKLLPGNWSQKKKDLVMLGTTMNYSDIVMNFASTITIDSSLFDTPVINIGFDGYNKEYLDSVRRYHDYVHYHNIVKTGGVRIAENQKELMKFINEYLKDPSLDRKGRKRIVKEQCYKLDTRSSQRVAKAVLDYLNNAVI